MNGQIIETMPKQVTPLSSKKRILRLFIWLIVSIVMVFFSTLLPASHSLDIDMACKFTWHGFPVHIFYLTSNNIPLTCGGDFFGCYPDCGLSADDLFNLSKYFLIIINIVIYYIILVIIDQIYLKIHKKRIYLLNILFFVLFYIISLLTSGPKIVE